MIMIFYTVPTTHTHTHTTSLNKNTQAGVATGGGALQADRGYLDDILFDESSTPARHSLTTPATTTTPGLLHTPGNRALAPRLAPVTGSSLDPPAVDRGVDQSQASGSVRRQQGGVVTAGGSARGEGDPAETQGAPVLEVGPLGGDGPTPPEHDDDAIALEALERLFHTPPPAQRGPSGDGRGGGPSGGSVWWRWVVQVCWVPCNCPAMCITCPCFHTALYTVCYPCREMYIAHKHTLSITTPSQSPHPLNHHTLSLTPSSSHSVSNVWTRSPT